jgi:hypothetical protein
MTTVEEILEAIDALPLADRLRVVERVVHEITSVVEASSDEGEEQATLVQRGGFLVVAGETTAPLDVFDHRLVREERISRLARTR